MWIGVRLLSLDLGEGLRSRQGSRPRPRAAVWSNTNRSVRLMLLATGTCCFLKSKNEPGWHCLIPCCIGEASSTIEVGLQPERAASSAAAYRVSAQLHSLASCMLFEHSARPPRSRNVLPRRTCRRAPPCSPTMPESLRDSQKTIARGSIGMYIFVQLSGVGVLVRQGPAACRPLEASALGCSWVVSAFDHRWQHIARLREGCVFRIVRPPALMAL